MKKLTAPYIAAIILSITFFSISEAQGQSWYNTSWLYRKAITIDYTKVGTGTHTNFPVLISRADADLQARAQADGDDILFTSADGTTKLAHEIESYTSASGTIVAWVEIPSLSSAANTIIYMYYGNAAATSQQNLTGTWDANFRGVYHLNNNFLDATVNNYDGTNTGTYDVPGKISRGRGYNPNDGGADKITIAGLMGSPASVTISSWFYRNSTATEYSMLMSVGDYVNMMRGNATESLEGNYYNGTTWLGTKTNINYDNGWHYAVYTCTANSQRIYVDGVLINSSTNASAISYTGLGANTVIGGHGNGSNAFDFDGNLDEVRVASAIRSAGWILTEYNNQNAPATFYSVGSQVTNTKTFTGTGNFSDAARWSGGTLPAAGDNLLIDGVCTVDNNAGTNNVAYGSLTIGTATGRTLSWAAGGTNILNVLNVSAGSGASTLNMTNGGTLIIRGTWTSTNLTFTPGAGTIELQSTITLPAAYATYYNLTVNGSGITVRQGVTTAISGDLTITSGTFNTNGFNTTLSGDLSNNGTFTAGTTNFTFTGAANTFVTGSSTTAFNTVTVNKGTSSGSVVDVQSVVTMAAGGLTLTNGTFKLSSNSTITPFIVDITAAPYRIPATAGLWVAGGTVTTQEDVHCAGLLHVSNGTLDIGDAVEDRLLLGNGSSLIIEGGVLNVAARITRISAGNVINFNMSGGTLTVPAIASTHATFAPFTFDEPASSFTMSGGTIIIPKKGTYAVAYHNLAGNTNVTGGTLQLGSATTPAGDTIRINSTAPIWNLTVNATNAPVAELHTNDFVVKNTLTISGGKLITNNLDLTIGGNWVNNGTFTPGTATVTFNGTTVMSGTTLSNTFNNFTVAASSTVASSTGLTGLVVNGGFTTGTGATLDLGTTTVLSGTLSTISNSGTVKTAVPTTTSATPIPAGKTWGGTVDYTNATANQTVVGGTYNNLTVRPGNSRVATASGNITVDGTLTVTTAFGAFDLSTYVLSGALTGIVNNGDIRSSVPTSTSATPIPAGKTWGGTIYYNAAAGGQTVVGGTYHILRFSNTSGANTASGNLTVNNQFITTAGGTLDMGSAYVIINMGSTITNNGTVKTSVLTATSATPFPAGKTWGGTGTVEYAATTGAQTVMSGTYNNLKLSNTSGNNTISGNVTLNGVLTLSGGTVTTNAFVISLNSTASVARTGGHVIGNLKKHVATGATTRTFEVGTGTNYTPLTVAFASVTTAEYLTVSATGTDHPNLSGSGIRTDRSVNRYWTLTNQGIVFTTATLTLNWVAADVDAGSATANFIVGNYNGPSWTLPAVASPLATSIQVTGLTSLAGSCAIGEGCSVSATFSYAGSPYCSNGGSAPPTITGTAGTFTSAAGLSINATTGVVNLAASTAGTYTVTNTVSGSGGCSAVSTASITISAAPSATISYSGSPYCTTGGTVSVTRTGTAGGTYSSTAGLSIHTTTGEITPATSTPGAYTISYTIAAANGCAAHTATASVTLALPGTWTGTVSSDWNASGNWLCGAIPASTTDVTIPGSLSNYPGIGSGTASVKNLTVQSGASLTVNGAVLQIAGAISNSGTITASNGTIEMNGGSAQSIPAATFAGNAIKSLTINNTAGVTLSGALSITDVLSVSAGSLNTGGYLTLKSTATGTARVAPVTSVAATPISGNVTVERYVPGRRRYRLITSPVTSSASAVLSAGQESLSIWGNWQNSGNNVTANTGTIITGGSAADGFDQQTINASLYTYNDATRLFTGFTTANGKNTKYTPLKAGAAYYMFVYGDRTNTITTSSPKNTVISSTGTLLTGDQVYNTSSAIPLSNVVGRYTLLGNPFASPINWATASKNNLANTFWGWDPNLNSTGGYVTVTTTGTVTLIAPFSGSVGLNQYIQSGQGFFVQTTGASPSLTIKEQDKVGTFNSGAFRTANAANSVNSIPLMAVNLLYDNAGTPVVADGTLAAFDAGFSAGIGQEDASELDGSREGIAIANAAELLSIDARPMPVAADTLFLNVARLTRPQYTLQIFSQQLMGNNLYAFLEDRYLHTMQPLSLVDTNSIVFNVTADAASFDANRFRIVFSSFTVLPVNFTQIKGMPVNNDIRITWQLAQETGIKKYIVERSANGLNFKAEGEVAVNDNNAVKSYEWLDVQPPAGNNYYRVRALQANGNAMLSKVVMVSVNTAKKGMVVFPNPVKDHRINIEITGVEKGEYKVLLFNSAGQQVATHVIWHDGNTSRQIIQLTKKLVPGFYHLRMQNESSHCGQDIFVE